MRLDGRTKEERSTIKLTDQSSEFSFSSVLPGKYRIEVIISALSFLFISKYRQIYCFLFLYVYLISVFLLPCMYVCMQGDDNN